MPAINKMSLLFTFAPAKVAGATTSSRLGGWSENFWYSTQLTALQIAALVFARVELLSGDCYVVGWRSTPYFYTGNKVVPGPSQAGALNQQGLFSGTNSPDDVLILNCLAGGVPVKWRMLLHAIPDNYIQSNQYVPSGVIVSSLQNWMNTLLGIGGVPQPVQWFGRDRTQVAQRVISVNIVSKSIVTALPLGGALINQSSVRLLKVYDDNGNPIKGVFNITAITANADGSVTYQLAGLPTQVRSTPSGRARIDLLAASPLTSVFVNTIAERKIGRPTMLFRGRRAKLRI